MNKNGAVYRAARPGEETAVSNLVARSFNEFIAPGFSEEGIDEFFKYANPRSLAKRSEGSHFVLVAEVDGEIAGMIEIRELKHISMLFVDKNKYVYGGRWGSRIESRKIGAFSKCHFVFAFDCQTGTSCALF